MAGALWQWGVSAGFTAAGLIAIGLGSWFHWSGVYLLIAPLLIALGITSGALFAGLSSPWWAVTLFSAVLLAFVVVRYIDPFGIGGAL